MAKRLVVAGFLRGEGYYSGHVLFEHSISQYREESGLRELVRIPENHDEKTIVTVDSWIGSVAPGASCFDWEVVRKWKPLDS